MILLRLLGGVALLGAVVGLAGCVPDLLPTVVRTSARDAYPFPPPNSYEYSAATLRSVQPFARWDLDRTTIALVTRVGATCDHVPTVLVVTTGSTAAAVMSGPAPRRTGEPACVPQHLLTTEFPASRLLDRNAALSLRFAGRTLRVPPAPALVLQRAERLTSRASLSGHLHPLRLIRGPLPAYSVPDSPWRAVGVTAASRSVRLSWIGGICEKNAALAYLRETSTSVVVDIAKAPPPITPLPPGSGRWGVCAGVGVTLHAVVVLRRPLGTRALLQHVHGSRPSGQNAD